MQFPKTFPTTTNHNAICPIIVPSWFQLSHRRGCRNESGFEDLGFSMENWGIEEAKNNRLPPLTKIYCELPALSQSLRPSINASLAG